MNTKNKKIKIIIFNFFFYLFFLIFNYWFFDFIIYYRFYIWWFTKIPFWFWYNNISLLYVLISVYSIHHIQNNKDFCICKQIILSLLIAIRCDKYARNYLIWLFAIIRGSIIIRPFFLEEILLKDLVALGESALAPFLLQK